MIDDEIPKHKSKKNTKKWCKGKVGKLHQPKWQQDPKPLSWNSKTTWLKYVCQLCQKELDYWIESRFFNRYNEFERPEIGSSEPLKKKLTDGNEK